MDAQEDFQARLNELKKEVNDEPFFGPYIVGDGHPKPVAERVTDTGFALQVVTADRKIDAAILHVGDSYWFHPRQLVVSRAQIDFPFFYLQGDVIPLFDLLDALVGIRKRQFDLFQLILDLEPVLRNYRSAPLKRNGSECLIPKYREMGFAGAPVKLQKESAVMRVVWLFPADRGTGCPTCYLPVGTIKFPLTETGEYGPGQFLASDWNKFFRCLPRYFESHHTRDAMSMLSPTGRKEFETALRSRKENGHPRTHQHQLRLRFIRSHPEHWSQPLVLGKMLQQEGLYSSKANGAELEWRVRTLIENVKRESISR